MPRQSLEKKTLKQLRDVCRQSGIRGYSGLNKPDLINHIHKSSGRSYSSSSCVKTLENKTVKHDYSRGTGIQGYSNRPKDDFIDFLNFDFITLEEGYLKDFKKTLQKKTVKQLYDYCRETGIQGYTNRPKDDLINFITLQEGYPKYFRTALENKTMNQLYEYCRQRNIRGYTNKGKDELIDHIISEVPLCNNYEKTLQNKTMKQLYDYCRETGIQGYTNRPKDDLINFITLQEGYPKYYRTALKNKTMNQLYEYCRQRNIGGYSNKGKDELIDHIISEVYGPPCNNYALPLKQQLTESTCPSVTRSRYIPRTIGSLFRKEASSRRNSDVSLEDKTETSSKNAGELFCESFLTERITWKIPNISSLPKDMDYKVQSSPFYFADAICCLQMWPKYISQGYIDLMIIRLQSSVPKHEISFKIYFKTTLSAPSENFNLVKRFNSHSNTSFTAAGTVYYLHQFQLDSGKFWIAPDDSLTVCCHMHTNNIPATKSDSKTDLAGSSTRYDSSSTLIDLHSNEASRQNSGVSLGAGTGTKSTSNSLYSYKAPTTQSFGGAIGGTGTKSTSNSLYSYNAPTTQSFGGAIGAGIGTKSTLNSLYSCNAPLTQISEEDSENTESKVHEAVRVKKLLQGYKEAFISAEDSDVTILVKGQRFRAHKVILKARSTVFASMFRHNKNEKATGIVDVEDCDPATFSDFLHFLYCGSVEKLSGENVFSLYAAADKYDVQDLKSECLAFMRKHLSIDTFCDTVRLLLQHCESDLLKLVTDFFVKNKHKIRLTVQWQNFVTENLT